MYWSITGIAFKCGTKVEYKQSILSSTELQFLVEVLFAGKRVGEGVGRTRREAQHLAVEGSLLYLAGGYSHAPDHLTYGADLKITRWFGISRMGGFVVFVIYLVTTFSLYVPDWGFVVYHDHRPKKYTVKCGMRGHLGPQLVMWTDKFGGINHLYEKLGWRRLKACTVSSPGAGPLREDTYLVSSTI
ncbi:Protein of unknown function (DUF1624 [Striga hermonthica]|uniref:DRBM domain-containing protein n=1 Tax=Striga hermonthica TaxID=68872 RepID=A0A9N7NU35_STRHE|nr:Protein of unknown function (DUF1624 [Striga hermonthica]